MLCRLRHCWSHLSLSAFLPVPLFPPICPYRFPLLSDHLLPFVPSSKTDLSPQLQRICRRGLLTETDVKVALPSEEAVRAAQVLYDDIRKAFPQAVADFNALWKAWHVACESQPIDSCVEVEEYKPLERLGPKTIPMVVHKLATDADQNSHGVCLCMFYHGTLSPLIPARQRH